MDTDSTNENNAVNAAVEQVKAIDALPVENQSLGATNKVRRRQAAAALTAALSTTQRKTIATGLISLLVVVALLFFAISPALASISKQLEVNQQLTARNAALTSKRDTLYGLIKTETDNADAITEFDGIFSERKYQTAIYIEVLEYLTESGLSFLSISFDQNGSLPERYIGVSPNDRLRVQQTNLAASGNYGQILAFLKKLEDAKRIFNVENLSFAPLDKNTKDNYRVSVNISTFYWVNPEAQVEATN